ncbi:MAG: tRNA (guanosine(37)-N1)-methyltransferase TrmD [candidate division Zixibacteria bacterium]|nr:tRNA (guanosine(37)-N1)-methyltransferase TrmD [candidate division Zixibacteria bacterium]
MRIDILTAFPGMFAGPFGESMVRLAWSRNLVDIFVYDLRAFTTDRHLTVDDYAYGGGSGMVLKPEPVFRGVRFLRRHTRPGSVVRTLLLSARGRRYTQETAGELAKTGHIILVCGHYKGIDERVVDGLNIEEFSIGDFVVTGGELPAMTIADSVVRLIPGVLNDIESATGDSFYEGLLDCPYYTRPECWENMRIPEILLSGHHERIRKWRRQETLRATWLRRPDLLENVTLSEEDRTFLLVLQAQHRQDESSSQV